MTETRFNLAEAHVVGFPGSWTQPFGIYPPIYHHGVEAFRGRVEGDSVIPTERHDKEWMRMKVKEGHVMLLEQPTPVTTDTVVLWLQPTLTPFFPNMSFAPIRKRPGQAAILKLSDAHAVMWKAIWAAGQITNGVSHEKELRAFHIVCHDLLGSTNIWRLANMAKRQLTEEGFQEMCALLKANAKHFGLPQPNLLPPPDPGR